MTRTRSLIPFKPMYGSYKVYRYTAPNWLLYTSGNNASNPPGSIQYGQCFDELHPYPYLMDGPLVIDKTHLVPVYLHGRTSIFTNNFGKLFYTDYEGYCVYRSTTGGIPSLPVASTAYWAAKALANVNPSTPVVDIPVFLFEFKDFPRMLRDLGRILGGKAKPSDIPGGHLAYHFGWKPLFSDLMSLLDLADDIERRKRLLMNAMRRGGARVSRRLGTFDYARVSYDGPFMWEQPVASMKPQYTFSANSVWDGNESAWYTARLSVDPTKLPVGNLSTVAARAVLGLNFSAASLWEMIPWSWLIDYFINIGTVMESQRGFIPFSISRFNVMIYQEYRRTIVPVSSIVQTVGGSGKSVVTRKNRIQPSLTAKFALAPFLTTGHQAIIASLITAKALRAIKL